MYLAEQVEPPPSFPKVKLTNASMTDQELDGIFAHTRLWLEDLAILELVKYTTEGGSHQLTICNLWRLVRMPNGTFLTFEHDLISRKWIEVGLENRAQWPRVPLFPIEGNRSLEWWRNLVRAAIWKTLGMAGLPKLPNLEKHADWAWMNVVESRCISTTEEELRLHKSGTDFMD